MRVCSVPMRHAVFLLVSAAALWQAYRLGQLLDRRSSHVLVFLFAGVTATAELVVLLQSAALAGALE